MDQQARFKVSVDSELSEVIAQLGKVTAAHEELTSKVGLGNAKIDNAYRSQSLAIGKLTTEITKMGDAERKAESERDKAAAQHEKSLKQIGTQYDYLGNQVSSFKNYLLGAFAVDQILNYGQKILDAAGNMQQFQISLEVMLQSKSKADKLMAEVIEFTKKTPFTLEQTQEATTRLLAYGVASEEVIRTLNSLGNIAAAVGTEKLPQLIMAFGQVKAAGHLTGAELRQFTEAGVNMFEALSATTGKSVAQIQKDISKGVISFADVQKAIFSLGEEGGRFANLMVKQSDTITGKLSNLGDSMYQFFAKLGTSRSGLIYGVTEALTDFFEWLGNSTRNMEIALSVVKGSISGWIAYKTILETVIKTKALLALETNAATAATAVNTAATVTSTVATGGLTGAVNLLSVAFRANPIGLIIGLLSSLYTAYQLASVATGGFTEEVTHETQALLESNKEIEIAILRAQSLGEKTVERKKAIADLVQQYPEYFAGLDAEKITNAQLDGVLTAVNGTFQDRIRLANLAYKADSLREKALALDREQLEVIGKLRKEYEGISKANPGNDEAFINAIKKQQGIYEKIGNYLPGVLTGGLAQSDIFQAGDVLAARKELEKERIKIANDAAKAQVDIDADAQKSIEINLLKRLNAGEINEKQYAEQYKKLTEDKVAAVIKTESSGSDKKKAIQKSSLELSLENQQKELKAQEQTLGVKLKLLDVEEDLKIEQTKRQIKNVEAREERILSIERQYEAKRQKLFYDSMHDALEKEIKEHETAKIKIQATRSDLTESFIKEYKVYASEVKKLEEEIEKIIVENAGKESDRKAAEFVEQAVAHKKFWQNRKDVEEAATYEINAQRINGWYEERRNLIEQSEILKNSTGEKYLIYLQYVKRINELNGLITSGEEEEAEKRIQLAQQVKERQMAIFQVLFSAMREGWTEGAEATIAGIERLEEISSRYYDTMLDNSRQNMQAQISGGQHTADELLVIWDKYQKEQQAILTNKDSIAEQAFYFKGMAKIQSETMNEMAKAAEQFSSGTVAGIVGGIVTSINALINAKQQAKILDMEMDVFRQEQAVNALYQEKQLLEERYQATKEALQKEWDDYIKDMDDKRAKGEAAAAAAIKLKEDERDAKIKIQETELQRINEFYDAEIAKAQEAFDIKQGLDEQQAEDSKRLLEASDRFRNDTLDAWIVRQVKQLEDERDRNLARATSDEEYRQIWDQYAVWIKDKHTEYEGAKLDESKAVKLGMEELSDQLKDTTVKNKQDETDEIKRLNGLRKDDEQAVKDEIERLKKEYAVEIKKIETDLKDDITKLKKEIEDKDTAMNLKMTENALAHDLAVRLLNRGIFEAERQMAALEIRTEIAKIVSSKSPNFNLLGQMLDILAQIMEMPNPYFKGTDWLERKNGEPAGRDTIHIRANEGERIVSTEDNRRLGGKKLSNKELVDGYIGYAQLREKFPQMFISMPSTGIKLNSLSGTPGGGGGYDPNLLNEVMRLNTTLQSEVMRLNSTMQSVNSTLENKPGITVNATKTGISILERRANSLNRIYTTRYRA